MNRPLVERGGEKEKPPLFFPSLSSLFFPKQRACSQAKKHLIEQEKKRSLSLLAAGVRIKWVEFVKSFLLGTNKTVSFCSAGFHSVPRGFTIKCSAKFVRNNCENNS